MGPLAIASRPPLAKAGAGQVRVVMSYAQVVLRPIPERVFQLGAKPLESRLQAAGTQRTVVVYRLKPGLQRLAEKLSGI